MDTFIERNFGPGLFRFGFQMPQIFELERGPQAYRHEGIYPRAIGTMYEQLCQAVGLQGEDKTPVWIAGAPILVQDVREIIRLAIIGGNCCTIDGQESEVGPTRARELVDTYVYPARPLEEGVMLAWDILRAAHKAIDVKKNDPA
jgi:hypothetical protein